MTRITVINQFYTPDISPTAHLSASLAESLAEQGHDVSVVASRGGYTRDADIAAHDARDGSRRGPRVRRIWTPRLGKATIAKRLIDYACFYTGALWALLTMPRQDVIISLTTPPYIAFAGVIHKLLHPQTKLVLWSMDCYPDAAERLGVIRRGGLLSRSMRAMNRILFRQIDHLISLDIAMEDLLVSQYASPSRTLPTTVIPNWERAELFPRDAQPGEWSKTDELGLRDRFVVLYLGNTGYGHHFDSVLEAAHQLRDDPVAFLFVGGGKRWGAIEVGVRARKLPNVILHPYVPKEETPSVMAAADCALITLRDDSLGVMSPSKLHANLAMRLPVIYMGPEKSNVDDAIRRFGCGVSARGDDPQAIVDFIRTHLSRGPDFDTAKERARRAFDSAYVDERTLPQFDEVIASLTAPYCDAAAPRAAHGR